MTTMPTTSLDPLSLSPGLVLAAGREFGRIGDELASVAQRVKGLRGQGAMHPTAAAAFDLMVTSQVRHGEQLARSAHLDAGAAEESVRIVQGADEASIVTLPGRR